VVNKLILVYTDATLALFSTFSGRKALVDFETMINKVVRFLLVFVLSLFLVKPVMAAEVTVHLFWSTGCPHCAKEKVFLENLKKNYPQVIIKDYEITGNRDNLKLLQQLGLKLKADASSVPFTVIGEEHFAGYLSDETTGKEIEKAINRAIEKGSQDLVSGLILGETKKRARDLPQGIPETLKVPLFGEIQLKSISLPLLTFIIALLDGFNPCAMWTLLFLISLLLGMKDRKRMWALGTAFIVSSALTYFLFLSAWLNLFLFLGFVVWVRYLVGLVALGSGEYYLRDYLTNKEGSCKVTGNEKRRKIFEKIKEITQKRQFILALLGIVLLAFAVNTVELICSAGLPAIYTKILSLSNLPTWQYYLCLLFYIFIFMLDDLFVFFVAMTTLRAAGIQSKYSRFSHLVGGLLMLIIGVLLLFKPEWLMFG